MDFGAHVHSLSALAELKAALLTFEAEARDALCQADLEIRRFLDWLGHDMVKSWQAEIRRREEAVAHARADLERARLSAAFGDEPDCTDQKVALARAKRRLAEAEEFLRITRRWLPAAEKEATDYRGPTQQLVNFLDADIPAAAARIERMLAALESYIAQAPPEAAQLLGKALPAPIPDVRAGAASPVGQVAGADSAPTTGPGLHSAVQGATPWPSSTPGSPSAGSSAVDPARSGHAAEGSTQTPPQPAPETRT